MIVTLGLNLIKMGSHESKPIGGKSYYVYERPDNKPGVTKGESSNYHVHDKVATRRPFKTADSVVAEREIKLDNIMNTSLQSSEVEEHTVNLDPPITLDPGHVYRLKVNEKRTLLGATGEWRDDNVYKLKTGTADNILTLRGSKTSDTTSTLGKTTDINKGWVTDAQDTTKQTKTWKCPLMPAKDLVAHTNSELLNSGTTTYISNTLKHAGNGAPVFITTDLIPTAPTSHVKQYYMTGPVAQILGRKGHESTDLTTFNDFDASYTDAVGLINHSVLFSRQFKYEDQWAQLDLSVRPKKDETLGTTQFSTYTHGKSYGEGENICSLVQEGNQVGTSGEGELLCGDRAFITPPGGDVYTIDKVSFKIATSGTRTWKYIPKKFHLLTLQIIDDETGPSEGGGGTVVTKRRL